jgi:hypothetical protein
MTEARSLMTKKLIKVKPEMPIQIAYEDDTSLSQTKLGS